VYSRCFTSSTRIASNSSRFETPAWRSAAISASDISRMPIWYIGSRMPGASGSSVMRTGVGMGYSMGVPRFQ
jgi:hypothetical protein